MLIVLEGLDGAGKSTQIRRLRSYLREEGLDSEYLHFPRFDAPFFGELIARFLRGEFGSAKQVDPYLVARGPGRCRDDDPQLAGRRQGRGAGPLRLLEHRLSMREARR